MAVVILSIIYSFFCGNLIPLFQRKMESSRNQVFIKEEIEEETKESLCDILSPVPIKEEDTLER